MEGEAQIHKTRIIREGPTKEIKIIVTLFVEVFENKLENLDEMSSLPNELVYQN